MRAIKVYDTAYFKLRSMAQELTGYDRVDDYDIAETLEKIMEQYVYGGNE